MSNKRVSCMSRLLLPNQKGAMLREQNVLCGGHESSNAEGGREGRREGERDVLELHMLFLAITQLRSPT